VKYWKFGWHLILADPESVCQDVSGWCKNSIKRDEGKNQFCTHEDANRYESHSD